MANVAGDITEITVNHPTLGTKTFYPKAGEAFTYDLGGITSDDDAAGIDGSGGVIRKMTNKRWSAEGTIAWDANDREDLEFIDKLAANPTSADWTLSWINGTTYAGKGFPVGDVQGDTGAGTIKLKIAGGGAMKKIA